METLEERLGQVKSAILELLVENNAYRGDEFRYTIFDLMLSTIFRKMDAEIDKCFKNPGRDGILDKLKYSITFELTPYRILYPNEIDQIDMEEEVIRYIPGLVVHQANIDKEKLGAGKYMQYSIVLLVSGIIGFHVPELLASATEQVDVPYISLNIGFLKSNVSNIAGAILGSIAGSFFILDKFYPWMYAIASKHEYITQLKEEAKETILNPKYLE